MTFSVGQIVTWTSQSQGYTKTKTGVIEQVVKPGEYPDRERFLPLYRGAGVGMARDHVSYVVRADKRIYWPRAFRLQLADDAS